MHDFWLQEPRTIHFIWQCELKYNRTVRAPFATFFPSSTLFPMSTTPPPEIWNDILKDNVAKNDPLWQDYSVKASEFDRGMVDKWNEIINVLLLYVGHF